MRRTGFLTLIFINFISFIPAAEAQIPLTLVDSRSEYDFGGHFSIIPDPGDEKTPETAFAELLDKEPEKNPEPNFGFSADTYWVFTRITNQSGLSEFILYIDFSTNQAELSCRETDRPESMVTLRSGSSVPQSERPYQHRHIVFPLRFEPDKTYDLILKIKTTGTTSLPLRLFTPEAFRAYNDGMNLFFGIMLGILAGLMLYILFIIIFARTTSYIYFTLFSVFHLFFQLSYNGISGLYLWPEAPLVEQVVLDIGIAGALIMSILFAMTFLQTKKHAPVFHRIFIATAIVAAVSIPLALFGLYRPSLILSNSLMLVAAILISVAAIRVYRSGYKQARFFIFAFLGLILSVLVVTMKNYSIIPSNFFTAQSVLFGSVVESILLSLAVADRINALRDENRQIETQLLESREHEIKLLKDRFYQDSMTGLDNRNRLILNLQRPEPATLFIINIDKFRQVNELYGTLIGNLVIIEIAKRLKDLKIQRAHTVYRLHADEFALLFPGAFDDGELAHLAEQVLICCQERAFVIDMFIIPLSVTLGIAVGDSNVLAKADIALSQAREAHADYTIYTQDLDTTSRIQSNLDCIQLLRYSIDLGTIFPVFMPILNHTTGKIEKYETLMRLRDSEGRIVPPARFLSVAKKSKLYPKLSQLILQKAFVYALEKPYEFSVNISVQDILNQESMAVIRENVPGHPNRDKIVFELLESESIEAYDPVARFIEEAKAWGCKIAIDDFGSGYSSFEHLLRLNIDYLKIDAILIKDIHTDRNARTVVETIAQFARRLKIQTIAEFVHCEEVYSLVRYLGINFSQGSFIGMPAEAI